MKTQVTTNCASGVGTRPATLPGPISVSEAKSTSGVVIEQNQFIMVEECKVKGEEISPSSYPEPEDSKPLQGESIERIS